MCGKIHPCCRLSVPSFLHPPSLSSATHAPRACTHTITNTILHIFVDMEDAIVLLRTFYLPFSYLNFIYSSRIIFLSPCTHLLHLYCSHKVWYHLLIIRVTCHTSSQKTVHALRAGSVAVVFGPAPIWHGAGHTGGSMN